MPTIMMVKKKLGIMGILRPLVREIMTIPPIITNSPGAKLMISVALYMILKPRPTIAKILPMVSPVKTYWSI
jgi:hypothetical protein